jgi:putative chitinase
MQIRDIISENEPNRIKLGDNGRAAAQSWIEKIYAKYPQTWQNNHVMPFGEEQFAMFELTPSFSKRGAVEVKWFQAYPLRAGIGSRAMQQLQAMAREDGIALTLFPWDKGQVSQAKLTKFYKGQGFTPIQKGGKSMQWEPVDEGWKDWVAGATIGAAALTAQPATAKLTQPAPAAAPQAGAALDQTKTTKLILHPQAKILIQTAQAAGIKGAELAQFLAQCAHESANFTRMKEFGGSLDFRKYDPKHNPRKAKILGNKAAGDGAKYAGRGFIQLTGRDNYKRAGQALGLPLEQKPELVERPDVAAKVAVWYWQQRVQPQVSNFNDTTQVTKPINAGLKGLEDRHAKFAGIMNLIKGKRS